MELLNHPLVRAAIAIVVLAVLGKFVWTKLFPPKVAGVFDRVRCTGCGWTGTVGKYNRRCPQCGGTKVKDAA